MKLQHIIFGTIGITLGFLIVLQSRVQPQRLVNPISPYNSLVDLRTQLQSQAQEFKTTIAAERGKQREFEQKFKAVVPDKQTRLEIDRLEEFVGLKGVSGEGVVVTLDDSKRSQPTADNIVHAADIRDVINSAWLGGATAISVNGQRVVATTSIDSVVNYVLINNTKIVNPFVIKIVGPSSNLTDRLAHQPELASLNRRVKQLGVLYHAASSQNVDVEEFSGSLKPNVVKITP